MDKHDKLQRIPTDDYDECGYADTKKMHMNGFNEFLCQGGTILQCVNSQYYHGFDTSMDENGMDKFVAMLAGMLFMIEHNEVEANQAYGTNWDINDFETGEYDDLFTPEDLKLIKADIRIIKDYLSEHPELVENPPSPYAGGAAEQVNCWKHSY